MADRTPTVQSAEKTLDVLNLLLNHFAHGLSPSEISKATGLDGAAVTRHVLTLEGRGFVERIPETGRLRPSVRLARAAVSILKALDDASSRVAELKERVTRTH